MFRWVVTIFVPSGKSFFWCTNLELFHWGPLSIPGAGGINVPRMVGKCWVKVICRDQPKYFGVSGNDWSWFINSHIIFTLLGTNIAPKTGTLESMIFLFSGLVGYLIVPWRVNIKLPQLISSKIQLDDVLFTQARSIDPSCLSWARVATTQQMGRGGLKEGCNIWDLSNEQWKNTHCVGYILDIGYCRYYPVMWRFYCDDPYETTSIRRFFFLAQMPDVGCWSIRFMLWALQAFPWWIFTNQHRPGWLFGLDHSSSR